MTMWSTSSSSSSSSSSSPTTTRSSLRGNELKWVFVSLVFLSIGHVNEIQQILLRQQDQQDHQDGAEGRKMADFESIYSLFQTTTTTTTTTPTKTLNNNNTNNTAIDNTQPQPQPQPQSQQAQGTPTPTPTPTPTISISIPILSTLRTDRSGSVIHDMLLAHAYAFSKNLTYLGACRGNNPGTNPTATATSTSPSLLLLLLEQHARLIAAIGLQDELPLFGQDCENVIASYNYNNNNSNSNSNEHKKKNHTISISISPSPPPSPPPPPLPLPQLVTPKVYAVATKYMTPKWLLYIRKIVQDNMLVLPAAETTSESTPSSNRTTATATATATATTTTATTTTTTTLNNQNTTTEDSKLLKIAVHIQRGDVHPCMKEYWQYLPNQHYLQILSRYVPSNTNTNTNTDTDTDTNTSKTLNNNSNNNQSSTSSISRQVVTIYSESRSAEPWSNFTALEENNNNNNNNDYRLALDADLQETWRAMISADILVLSSSSFSFVPALLNYNINANTNTNANNTDNNNPNKNKNKIIYTRFWHRPLKGWIEVEDDIMQQTKDRVVELMKEHGCLKRNATRPSYLAW